MTESEWLANTHIEAMLEALEGKVSERKLRLFAVACCYRLGDLLWDAALENAIRVAEAFADNRRSKSTLVRAWNKVEQLQPRGLQREYIHGAVSLAVSPDPDLLIPEYVADSALFALADFPEMSRTTINKRRRSERTVQANLLRDIVGSPFRVISLKAAWLTFSDGVVAKLAQAIYEERAFDRLPVLADALEEAGCDKAEILEHLRGPGPHTRGCWPVDLCLGRS
jgi:hypothetical protein